MTDWDALQARVAAAEARATAARAEAYRDFSEEASVAVRTVLKPGAYRDRLLDTLRAMAARERLAAEPHHHRGKMTLQSDAPGQGTLVETCDCGAGRTADLFGMFGDWSPAPEAK